MRGVLEGKRVLVLEDEFLIAMEVEQLCRDNGAADVVIARSLEETAPAALALEAIDFAIIDVTLGGRSALGFADRLRDSRLPFVFASGYGAVDEMFARFPGIPVVGKPYADGDLMDAVRKALARIGPAA